MGSCANLSHDALKRRCGVPRDRPSIDPRFRTNRTQTKTVDGFEAHHSIAACLAHRNPELCRRRSLDCCPAARLAALGAAKFHNMSTRGPSAEIMVEGQDAMNVGPRQIQSCRYGGHQCVIDRSEEHTPEFTSIRRIPYAVF